MNLHTQEGNHHLDGTTHEDPNEIDLNEDTQENTNQDDTSNQNDASPEATMRKGDLEGTPTTEVDMMMFKVYGDKVHQNDGTHLDGGIADDQQ